MKLNGIVYNSLLKFNETTFFRNETPPLWIIKRCYVISYRGRTYLPFHQFFFREISRKLTSQAWQFFGNRGQTAGKINILFEKIWTFYSLSLFTKKIYLFVFIFFITL